MKKLLVVVDMINGFINEGNLHDKGIGRIVPFCGAYIDHFIDEKQDVVAFCDSHQEDSVEFASYPSHCIEGSTECDLVPELAVFSDDIDVVTKNSTNGFFAPGFQKYIEKLDEYYEIVIVGCCTDICVLQFALSLKAYCNEKGYNIKIIVDELACETFDIEGHSRDEYNQMAYSLMRNSGIEVIVS